MHADGERETRVVTHNLDGRQFVHEQAPRGYYALVVQKIREKFNIYNWQQKKALVAVVHIELFPTGRVRSTKILKRSSDRLYDSAVLQAIQEADPLPAPDDPSVIEGGLDFEFRPQ